MGSHRKNGYTKKALDYILSQAPSDYEITVDWAIDKKVAYCKSCYYCERHKGECVIKDDMTQIYRNFIENDQLLFISSIYFSSAPSALKTILDRCQMFYCNGKMDLPHKDVLCSCSRRCAQLSGTVHRADGKSETPSDLYQRRSQRRIVLLPFRQIRRNIRRRKSGASAGIYPKNFPELISFAFSDKISYNIT